MATARKIEIEYADGTIDRAEGEQAAAIWAWLESCQMFAVAHGAQYDGPQFAKEGK